MTVATQADPTPPLPGPVRRRRAVTSIEYALIAGAMTTAAFDDNEQDGADHG